MSARPQKRARYGEKGKSAYLKRQKAMAVRMVPRPMRSARSYNGPLPNQVSAVLIYSESISINAGAAAWGGNVYSANGIFQCDITAGAGQPRGRDELFAMYNHAYVTASYITVRTCGNTINNLTWGIAVRDDAVAFTDFRDFTEYRNSKINMIGVEQNAQVMTHKCVPHKFLGLKTAMEDQLQNTNAANPSEGVYYHVGCCDSAKQDPGPNYFTVRIVYYVTFTEPLPMAAS